MTGFEIGWQLYMLLFGLIVVLPVVSVWLLCRFRRQPLRPALWSMVGATTMFLLLSWGFSRNSVTLDDNQLALQAGFYQTQIDNIGLASSAVQVLPQDKLGEFTPAIPVNAIRLPNYQVGWFLLQNRQLAFVMLIGPQQEVSLVRSGEKTAVVGGNLFYGSDRMVAAR